MPRERRPRPWDPSDWVCQWYDGIAKRGRVLDVACGAGRHFSLALSSGRRVVGVDRDISQCRYDDPNTQGVTMIEADLERGDPPPWAGQRFEGVIVTNYLHRPLLPAIVDAVADDGMLIYETFAVGQERYGKPSNPDFLLRPGELMEVVAGRLVVFGYEHCRHFGPERILQHIAAVGPRHAWVLDPLAM